MNTKIKIFLLCPVPENQKPMTEYIETKENSFFNWITSGQFKYTKNVVLIYLYCFFFFVFLYDFDSIFLLFKNLKQLPVFKISEINIFFECMKFDNFTFFNDSFKVDRSSINFLRSFLKTMFLSGLTTSVIFLFLKFRWISVENRFNTSQLFYEESSWFDGQTWEKPFFLIKNDKLISTQKIKPVILRINQTLRFFIFFNAFVIVLLKFYENILTI